jgi:hypothetical protein
MKKAALSILSLSLLLSFGCASKDYVRQQMEPLVERVSKLEAKGDCCEKAKECCEQAKAGLKEEQEAAKRCEKKCEKSFELQQVK